MTKQELLTKLAMECSTWADALAYPASRPDLNVWTFFNGCGEFIRIGGEVGGVIGEKDWLAERERLLNKPGWADAPKGVTHKAMDKNGWWSFYNMEPDICSDSIWVSDDFYDKHASTAIAIPAGYDWKQSLEERPV